MKIIINTGKIDEKTISETLDLNTKISMLEKILEIKYGINMYRDIMVFNAKRTDKNLTLA